MTRKKAILVIITAFFAGVFGFALFKYGRKTTNRSFASNNNYKDLVDAIAEVIIPKTDTPGAEDARVINYIINVVDNCYSDQEKDIFFLGLDKFEQHCIGKFSKSFLFCSIEEKSIILTRFENKNLYKNPIFNKIRRKILGQSFFEQIKWLTVSGYCNSRIGATEGLQYESIPIKFISCTPYLANQKSWATK